MLRPAHRSLLVSLVSLVAPLLVLGVAAPGCGDAEPSRSGLPDGFLLPEAGTGTADAVLPPGKADGQGPQGADGAGTDPGPGPGPVPTDDGGVDAAGPDSGPIGDDGGSPDAASPGGDDLGAPDAPMPGPDSDPGPPPVEMTPQGSGAPLPCADPTVLADHAAPATQYVFCTGMKHVWKTSDWDQFTDQKAHLVLDLTGMPARSQSTASWWAPGAIYDAAHSRYVMWVSVKDLDDESRSLAVLTSPAPLGPWKFRNFARRATASGQNHIDPMLFRSSNGSHYVYWKHYGGGLTSKISGARLDDALTHIVASTEVAIMNGYNSSGWELNVRENPAVWEDTATGTWHMLYSGAHWRDDTYATGHASSKCGPLCLDASRGGWHIAPSHDRDVPQVVQAKGTRAFASGGPGGAVWVGDDGHFIVYAAAHRSASGDTVRYLQRDRVRWSAGVPYVDNPGHHPSPAPTR